MNVSIARPSVLCTGVAVLDNMFSVAEIPAEPTKIFAKDFRQIGGGPGANAAVTIARLGGHATLWARVGDDRVGADVVSELAEYGVDTSTIRQVPGRRTGVSAVAINTEGERLIFAFADRDLDTDPSWLPEKLPSGTAVVLCDVRWPAASSRILQLARNSGIPTVLDADLTNDDAVEKLIGFADHAVFSAPALKKLSGTADVSLGLRAAKALTAGVVSVTLGERGFAWLDNQTLRLIPAFNIDPVDTLGAGDVFHGAFALGIAEGGSIEAAGRFASAAAAMKCQRWGGRAGIPTRPEVDEFLRERVLAGATA